MHEPLVMISIIYSLDERTTQRNHPDETEEPIKARPRDCTCYNMARMIQIMYSQSINVENDR